MNKIVHRFSTEPHTPERICWCYPNQVMFLCATGFNFGEVRQVQCGSSQPTMRIEVAHVTLQHRVHDMCCIKLDSRRTLLVLARGDEGVWAYNVETDQLSWHVKGKPPGMQRNMSAQGITVAYRPVVYGSPANYCYVCDDKNFCVHMLSSTGEYTGRVSNAFEGLGGPWRIRCSSVLETLFVTYITKQGRHQVARFKPVTNPNNVVQRKRGRNS